jgi:SIR2-like domain
MRPTDLFAVLAGVAAEHAAVRSDGPSQVIPVLVGALESPRDLLEQSAELLGGILLDLTSGNFASAIAAYDDSGLRAEVETALSSTRPRTRIDLELSYSSGEIDARLKRNGTLSTVLSAADEELLAVARSLFDERLLRCEMAILLLSENSFDRDNRHRVLQMLTGLAGRRDLRLGSARTLVVFIQSDELSVSRHCQPKRGIRFSLIEDRLVQRNPFEQMGDTVRKLVVPRDQPLVLFLAAGFSVSSDMPVGNGLRDEAIKRICELDPTDSRRDEELALVLFEYATSGGRTWLSSRELGLSSEEFARTLTLEQVGRIEAESLDVPVPPVLTELKRLHDARLTSGDPLGRAVYELDRIIERSPRLVLITVNFDELIEHAHPDRLDVAVSDADFVRLKPILEAMREGGNHPDGKIPLLKLHGTISRLETCVVTDEQTRSGISEAKQNALLALVSGLDSSSAIRWTYVGASMRDIDLTHVFSLGPFAQGANERWVAPYLEPSVELFVANTQRFWTGRENLLSRTVTETADAFMAELAARWPH